MENHTVAKLALASLLTLSSSAALQTAQADSSQSDYVKCYGVAKAGMNGCGTAFTGCSATVQVDNACYAWIYAPSPLCKKLAHSSVGEMAPGCKLTTRA